MLKSRRLAYDGRGNAVVASAGDLPAAVEALGGFDRGLYAEKWAPFSKELSVMVARCAPVHATRLPRPLPSHAPAGMPSAPCLSQGPS